MNKAMVFFTKNAGFSVFAVAILVLGFSDPAYAGLASLDKSTTAITTITKWLTGFTIAGSLAYITYLVLMAFAEKKAWSDVMMGLAYCAIAGGVLAAGTWATTLWT